MSLEIPGGGAGNTCSMCNKTLSTIDDIQRHFEEECTAISSLADEVDSGISALITQEPTTSATTATTGNVTTTRAATLTLGGKSLTGAVRIITKAPPGGNNALAGRIITGNTSALTSGVVRLITSGSVVTSGGRSLIRVPQAKSILRPGIKRSAPALTRAPAPRPPALQPSASQPPALRLSVPRPSVRKPPALRLSAPRPSVPRPSVPSPLPVTVEPAPPSPTPPSPPPPVVQPIVIAPIDTEEDAGDKQQEEGPEDGGVKPDAAAAEEDEEIVIICDYCGEDISDPSVQDTHDLHCTRPNLNSDTDSNHSDDMDSIHGNEDSNHSSIHNTDDDQKASNHSNKKRPRDDDEERYHGDRDDRNHSNKKRPRKDKIDSCHGDRDGGNHSNQGVRMDYTCELCNDSFVTEADLGRHKRGHVLVPSAEIRTAVFDYRCKECGEGFPTRRDCRTHQAEHERSANKTCRKCGRTFTTRLRLNYHLIKVCGKQGKPGGKPGGGGHPPVIYCQMCYVTFQNEAELGIHQRRTGHSQVRTNLSAEEIEHCRAAFVRLTDIKPALSTITKYIPALLSTGAMYKPQALSKVKKYKPAPLSKTLNRQKSSTSLSGGASTLISNVLNSDTILSAMEKGIPPSPKDYDVIRVKEDVTGKKDESRKFGAIESAEVTKSETSKKPHSSLLQSYLTSSLLPVSSSKLPVTSSKTESSSSKTVAASSPKPASPSATNFNDAEFWDSSQDKKPLGLELFHHPDEKPVGLELFHHPGISREAREGLQKMSASFQCNEPGCNRKFTTMSHLTAHSKTHNPDPALTCNICHRSFTDWYKLNYHKRHVCGKPQKGKYVPVTKKTVTCQHCGQTYNSEFKLQAHVIKSHNTPGDD